MNVDTEKYKNLKKRFNQIKTAHQLWIPAYQELKTYINPIRGIFYNDRSSVSDMIDHQILLNAHATHALRIFASGMNSGMTDKSSQWFRLTVDDSENLEIPGFRQWLDSIQNIMYAVINQSNLYESFYNSYEELGQFGTSCFIILEDQERIIRSRMFTCGEYYLSTDEKGRVNKFAREGEMTVDQMVKEFGLESCSTQVKSLYENKQIEQTVKYCHMIEPNEKYNPEKEDYLAMPYRSVYWEAGSSEDTVLAIRGYKRFRVVAPRWSVISNTVYGYGPGWHALGSVKELQKTREDKLLAQEKIHNPPVVEDGTVEGHTNLLPGGVTKSSASNPNPAVKPAYMINARLESFIQLIDEEKEEIDKFFYVNLFLMLMNAKVNEMTATEVAERQQEKIMMMGPALHRLDEEMLTPTLEIVFDILLDAGLIPPPPPQAADLDIKIEYTSILAQAQRALGVTKIERVMGFVGTQAQIFPDMLDVVDSDEAARLVADMEGAPAKIIRDRDVVDKLRKQRQRQAMMQQAAALANSAADTTQKLSNSPMNQGSVLDGMRGNA